MKGLIFLLILWLVACATSLHKAIREIELGMDKSEVVERLGSPSRTNRNQGTDKWIYIYNADGHKRASEIHFRDSKVIYRGPSKKGTMSQEIEDSSNYKEYKESIEKKARQKSQDFESL